MAGLWAQNTKAPSSTVWADPDETPQLPAQEQPHVIWAPTPKVSDETVSAQPVKMADPGLDLHGGLVKVFAPQPEVSLNPDPMAQIQGHEQNRLLRDYQKDANPLGSANNHPGFLGKLAHGLSVATGGDTRRQWEEQGLAKQISDNATAQGENQLRGAQATNQESETADRDQQAKQKADQPATTPKPYTLSTDEGELQWDGNNWSPITVNGETAMAPTKAGSSTSLQKTKGQSAGKEIYANYNPSTGKYTDTQGKELSDFTPYDKPASSVYGSYAPMRLVSNLLNTAYKENPAILPVLGPVLGKIMNQLGATGDASSVFSALPAGQPQNESGAPIGTAMPESPTGTTRTRGQFAGSVLPTMQEASDEIDKLADKLGPMAGRYNELVTGKIGAYGPEFSGLQTDLHNISTAWARLHVDSESARKEFIQDIGAAKDPANLKEKLSHYEHQAQIYKQTGAGRPNAGDQTHTIGEIKTFPNGNKGKWDGTGWEAQ